jgi:hypothetical protein
LRITVYLVFWQKAGIFAVLDYSNIKRDISAAGAASLIIVETWLAAK